MQAEIWVLDAAALQPGSVDPAARPLVADLVLASTKLNWIAEHYAPRTER